MYGLNIVFLQPETEAFEKDDEFTQIHFLIVGHDVPFPELSRPYHVALPSIFKMISIFIQTTKQAQSSHPKVFHHSVGNKYLDI